MLGHGYFNFSTTRKYISYFGTVFNDINIKRFDAASRLIHVIKVPIQYGPREKFLARIDGDPNLFPGTAHATILPRMSFEIIDWSYDATRMLPGTVWLAAPDSTDNDKLKHQYTPVPYNLMFRLSVFCKNAEDGTKIIEQIIPFFRPDWTASLELIEELPFIRDIPLVLDKVECDDVYTDTFEKRRALVWSLSFTMKGWYFVPITQKPIIKFTTTNFLVDANNAPLATVTITPGLDANGAPTSDANVTVPWTEINILDDYGFIEEYEGLRILEE